MIKHILLAIFVILLIGTISAENAVITAYVVDSPKADPANLGVNHNVSLTSNSQETQMVGNDRDSHGCIGSAGYSWCESKSKCLRIWEENCSITEENKTKVYILPEVAAKMAMDVHNALCSANNCTVLIKEVPAGNKSSNETRVAFVLNLEKSVKVLGFIKTNMRFQAYMDAQTGDSISTKKPWWAFLAMGS
jgi:hypothetical protein